MVTETIEEYLEAIHKLEQDVSPVTISALAERLGISSASVSEMAGKLAEQGLATREPYKGVVLTSKGRSQALILIRRHRLWECFLTDVLGLPWDQVHEQACRLEHATSPLVEEGLAQFLGEPETCPHGHPMPTADGEIAVEDGRPLAELTAGRSARVLRVPERDSALLQYLYLGIGTRDHASSRGSGSFPGSADGAGRSGAARLGARTGCKDRSATTVTASAAPQVLGESERVLMNSNERIPLNTLTPGEIGVVRELAGGRGFMSRLATLGFTPGAKLTMVQNFGHGPLIVNIRGTRIALGRGEAAKVVVTKG